VLAVEAEEEDQVNLGWCCWSLVLYGFGTGTGLLIIYLSLIVSGFYWC